MKTLFKTTFGSHLYGTNTEQSDTDYKAIYLPEIKDIILGRVPVTSLTYSTGSDNGKNTNNDVDTEIFTLRGFFRMLQEGQMVALDMLFSPEQFWIEHTNTWINILQNKDKILNKNIHGYIGYINKQCAKYGMKGSRISELREVITFFKNHSQHEKLTPYNDELVEFTKTLKHSHVYEEPAKGDRLAVTLFECCGKKIAFDAPTDFAIMVFERALMGYGNRALEAEKNANVDWKAVSHAVRAIYQAQELLTTGHITFPCPDREHILDVKLGKIHYTIVSEWLERNQDLLVELQEKSKLPLLSDKEWMDEYVLGLYGQ